MYIDFNEMPPQSRVWIYQSNRELSNNEEISITNYLKNELTTWAAHGSPLAGSAIVLHHRFVIIAEASHGTSGCSIDASTRWIKELGTTLNLDFFDRSIAYLVNDEIKTVSPFAVKKAIQENEILAETMVFMNNILTVEELSKSWKCRAEATYLSRYFEVVASLLP